VVASGAKDSDDSSSGRASTKPGYGIVVSRTVTLEAWTQYLVVIGHHGEDSNGGVGGVEAVHFS
jgi:hypothetical protein